jgi:hypothetical protein
MVREEGWHEGQAEVRDGAQRMHAAIARGRSRAVAGCGCVLRMCALDVCARWRCCLWVRSVAMLPVGARFGVAGARVGWGGGPARRTEYGRSHTGSELRPTAPRRFLARSAHLAVKAPL